MPIHTWDTPFWRLFHKPSEPVTLKEVFDNLKNYAVCGGMLYLAAHASVPPVPWGRDALVFLKLLAIVLAIACFLQSWILAQKAFYQFFPLSHDDHYKKPLVARLKYLLLMSIPIILGASLLVVGSSYV